MKKYLLFTITLILFISLSTASHVPFDGMTLEYETTYEFENQQYPSADSQETDDVVLSFAESGDTYEVTNVGSGSSINVEGEYGVDLSTTFWIPHDLEVGDEVEITGFEYGVSTLSRTIELEDFGEVEAVELRYSNSSEETTTGDMEVTDYTGSETRYYHAETGLLLKSVEENSYTHTTSYLGEMDKTETSTLEIQENNIDTDDDSLTDLKELVEYSTDPTKEDTDEDGLTDRAEVQDHNTNPTEADTDEDNLTDEEEVNLGTDPTERDTDDDGLEDQEELREETDPLKVDTDEDGVDDGREVAQGSDPLAVDGDDDGLNDSRELELGTDPLSADTDGDGLNDSREVETGSDPTVADTDGDGLNDAEEVEAGTSPVEEDTDGDFLPDNIDPMPASPLLPNSLAVLLIAGAGYYFKSKGGEESWNPLN